MLVSVIAVVRCVLLCCRSADGFAVVCLSPLSAWSVAAAVGVEPCHCVLWCVAVCRLLNAACCCESLDVWYVPSLSA